MRLVLTAPFLNEEIHGGQFFFNLIGISGRLINLVDGEYDRHTGSHSMVDGFFGLRHHVVIGSYDDNGNIRRFGTAGTHGGKRLMTRSIEERYLTSVFQRHVISTDVLCNTTGFTGNNIRLTDIVEQRSFTVVYVTHYRYNRSAML